MPPKRSATKTRDQALADEAATLDALQTQTRKRKGRSAATGKTFDSFNNFAAKLGVGADNLLSSSTYGFNPITRIRTLLEWIHRGSWIGGLAIDVVAEDMTRAGVDILGELKAEDRTKIEEAATSLDVWGATADNVAWSRLYGGCIAVHLVKGQDYSTPLKINTVGKGQYCGQIVLDRWMVRPSLEDLVTEEGPFMGLPKFYTVDANAPGLRTKKIHYTRVIRLEGVRLPYWQRVAENMWGISVLERLFDRLVIFDSATTGAGQLVYKAYIRTYAIKGLREIAAAGGKAMEGLIKQIELMRQFASSEGITLLDAEDEYKEGGTTAYTGLADVLMQFAMQISGALQVPLVRLLGQSPAGLNSSGESDLRTYYDGILQKQNRQLKIGMTMTYRMLAQSEGIKVPDGFGIQFRSLWQLTENEKSEIAERDTRTFTDAVDKGVVTPVVAMREMRNSGTRTGRWTMIADQMIEDAEAEAQVPTATKVEVAEVNAGEEPGVEEPAPKPGAKP